MTQRYSVGPNIAMGWNRIPDTDNKNYDQVGAPVEVIQRQNEEGVDILCRRGLGQDRKVRGLGREIATSQSICGGPWDAEQARINKK